MPEFGSERQENPESLYRQLAAEANQLYATYKDMSRYEFMRKRAEDLWNRIDRVCVSYDNGETVHDGEYKDLLEESKKIRSAIKNGNY